MAHDLGWGALAGLFGFVFFGSVIPVVPTGAAVSAAAVVARTEAPWEVVLVVLAGWLGAYAGDVLTFLFLNLAGPPAAARIGWLNAGDPQGAIQRMRAGIESRGVRALLVSRLVPGGRVPVLMAAALGGYPVAKFLGAGFSAAGLWALMYASIGALGQTLFGSTRTAVVVVVVVAVLVSVVPGRLRRGG